MNTRTSLLACTLALAGTCAWAESPLGTGLTSELAPAAAFSPSSTQVMGGPPGAWKGLTREEVATELSEARRNGNLIPAGEAIGYPYALKGAAVGAMPTQMPEGKVMGGPPTGSVTTDGYRFVGGEAGYEFVGRPGITR
jgi:hypothetical protein